MNPPPLKDTPSHSLVIDDGVATITLLRTDRLNALHPAAHHALSSTFDALAADAEIRAVILTGAGRAFCVGYDIKDSIETGVMEIAPTGFGGLTNRLDFPHPLIAAVNGPAMGGGFEMALACDLIVASETATFALPEVKIGWVAAAGGVQRLPRAIGIKRALGVILTGRAVSAQEGLTLGFVNEVTPDSDVMDAARRWAGLIAANAPLAVRATRDLAYRSMDLDVGEMLDMAHFPEVTATVNSEDAVEGRRAFLERRAPAWRSR